MILKKEREQVIGSVSISRWQDYDSWKRSKTGIWERSYEQKKEIIIRGKEQNN